ncbi:alkaline phosphatase D family protein [Gellertiella hungarica]|uniref:Alkaline phosphatase D n=1 Tax=Gellertiella hungarica TaxID=1572859 RepID=A0A7W6J5Q3_9HYPH|nr:alkaline phosphatase D family protein [Gellertiella hungarica]MBB4065249.1 alkaline phosphatase D [Gellertiella hungarica]
MLTRRNFLFGTGALGLSSGAGLGLPYYNRNHGAPVFTHGVQSGDVDFRSAAVWTRTDRPARVEIELSTTESFSDPIRLPRMTALPDRDFAVKAVADGLLPDQDVFYRFRATDLHSSFIQSDVVSGRFRTAPLRQRSIRFLWSGDTAGQGWGIDDEGMATYRTMAEQDADFFIHSGDTVYADNPIPDEVRLRDGSVWRNRIVTDEKREVARTLHEYRGQWKYNLLDHHVRAFNAGCAAFYQWDDHEVLNNWSPSTDLRDDPRYPDKDIAVYARRARKAFEEMTPIRYPVREPGRIYRKISYGPLLDIFFLDLRSYRSGNRDSSATALLGRQQTDWLCSALSSSSAVWKVVASDMPIGLVQWDDYGRQVGAEGVSDGYNGVPDGREHEIAHLLRTIMERKVRNIVWLTADVHYTAAHHYSPERAKFLDFLPFWEFVSGPLHAGTYGPKPLDKTFGPEVHFVKAAPGGVQSNLPPSAGLQFFGRVDIHGRSREMTVRLMDRQNRQLWSVTLSPDAAEAVS